MSSALELADGVECLGVAAVAGGSASGSGGGSAAGIPLGPSLNFSLEQTGNINESPLWFESAGKTTVAVSFFFALVFARTSLGLAFPSCIVLR